MNQHSQRIPLDSQTTIHMKPGYAMTRQEEAAIRKAYAADPEGWLRGRRHKDTPPAIDLLREAYEDKP